jgi:type IV secretory pathway VirB3-like protein
LLTSSPQWAVWAGPVLGIPNKGGVVVGLIVALLVLWLVLTVLGFLIKSLFWLAIVGLLLFAATSVWGAARGRRARGALR